MGNEFLVFTLGEEEYGIDILKVQEIRGYDAATVTRIANVPSFIKGVTNLRGIIVPIVDLRISSTWAASNTTSRPSSSSSTWTAAWSASWSTGCRTC